MNRPILWTVLFAVAFAWVEASVVVYLRELYYPGGFTFPLQPFVPALLWIEIVRELATLFMLGSIAMLAGTTPWQRFAHFVVAFGVWDIFFYAWLKVILDWPASLFDWDILFLVPLPWIGPVIAPVLISLFLILAGILLLRYESTRLFQPTLETWVVAVAATLIFLWSFMEKTDVTLHGAMPSGYSYLALSIGLFAWSFALWRALRQHRKGQRVTEGG